MNTLTNTQAKLVLQHFAAQAAAEAPEGEQGEIAWDTHAWQTLYTASVAIGRRITEHDWHTAVVSFMDLQSFDRDAAAYLHERGYSDSANEKTYWYDTLNDLAGWAIDLAYSNSGA